MKTKVKITAKCPANQMILDQLVAKRDQIVTRGGAGSFAFTLKRAIESLQQSREPITTSQEAQQLQHIGPSVAQMLFPEKQRKRPPTTTTSSSSKRLNSRDEDVARIPTKKPTVARMETTAVKRQRLVPPPPCDDSVQDLSFLPVISVKEKSYEQARQTALDWKNLAFPLVWKVVLLIDGRERQCHHICAKCQMSGIPAEERHLPIGDMLWIAQGYRANDKALSKRDPELMVELVLGTIIERKSMEDLKASLFGTRYAEQRLRLKESSGCPQILFLVEGDVDKDLFRCPSDTLLSAIYETRLHMGFSIVHTAHMDDTVKTLKRMHRRILKRAFPTAFRKEALPTFAEPDAARIRHERMEEPNQPTLVNCRHRRRRLESLMELCFDTDPTLPMGMERFITYHELKARVERDRELGTRTIGNIHLAMLKQVPTFSSRKCQAVANVYPTTHALMDAYHKRSCMDARKQMVAELRTSDAVVSWRDCTIGSRSSLELFVAYGIGEGNNESMDALNVLQPKTPAPASLQEDSFDLSMKEAHPFQVNTSPDKTSFSLDAQLTHSLSERTHVSSPARMDMSSNASKSRRNAVDHGRKRMDEVCNVWELSSDDDQGFESTDYGKKRNETTRVPLSRTPFASTTALPISDQQRNRSNLKPSVASPTSIKKTPVSVPPAENHPNWLLLSPDTDSKPTARNPLDLSWDTSMEITPSRFVKGRAVVTGKNVGLSKSHGSSTMPRTQLNKTDGWSSEDELLSIARSSKRSTQESAVEVIEID